MEAEITETEATEAAGMTTGTGITQEPERKAKETRTPRQVVRREDVWRPAERKGVQPRLWPGPQLRQSGRPRQSREQRRARRTDEWSPGTRRETTIPLQLAKQHTAATRPLSSTSDLVALRAERTLLRRLPEPADRQEVRALSGTQHHDGPHTPVSPCHRPAPKSGGGRALGRPALPLQSGARPNGAPPAPPHPPHTLASTTPTHVLTLPGHH